MGRQVSGSRIKAVPSRQSPASADGSEGTQMSQFEDLILKLDHLQSTITNVSMDLVSIREYQSAQKENNQKFQTQDWPKVIHGQEKLQEQMNAIERELISLAPLNKQLSDHEDRLRKVEHSVVKMGMLASLAGAVVGVIVTWVSKFVKFGT